MSREKSWIEVFLSLSRFYNFHLSHSWVLQTKIVLVVLCTCSQRTVASQKKISVFCQLLLFVKFCQKQNRIKNNKQTSSFTEWLLFTKRDWWIDCACVSAQWRQFLRRKSFFFLCSVAYELRFFRNNWVFRETTDSIDSVPSPIQMA